MVAPSYNNFILLHIKGNGDSVSVVQQNKPVPVAKDYQRHLADRFGFFPELDYNKPGYSLALDSSLRAVNGDLAYLVIVTHPDGTKVKCWFDPKTGYKVKQVTDVANSSPTEFNDYRDVNGAVKIPYESKNQPVGCGD